MKLLYFFIIAPERIASHFSWAGALIARVTVGYVFMLTGWGKLHNLPQVTEFFASLSIPAPHILTPFVSGLECIGGLFLIFGIGTRICSGGLAITMMVAVISARWMDIDSLHTLLGFEETLFFTIFTWLAINGAGRVSIDSFLSQRYIQSR